MPIPKTDNCSADHHENLTMNLDSEAVHQHSPLSFEITSDRSRSFAQSVVENEPSFTDFNLCNLQPEATADTLSSEQELENLLSSVHRATI